MTVRKVFFLLQILPLLPLASCATAHKAGKLIAPIDQHRFYKSRDYGTERQFNPLTEIVNEGFDLLRGDDADRRVFQSPYSAAATNLRISLFNPGKTWRMYGGTRLSQHELFPLSLRKGGGGEWIPNYQFHLIGSGMVSARMAEWFSARGIPHPVLMSAVTMTAAHFLNEMTERPVKFSEDAITDLLIFDPAGLLLFRLDAVQKFFSGPAQLTNWPLQPSLAFPGKTLENVGQEFVIRFKVPSTENWKFLYIFGVSTLGGLSRNIGQGRSISFGLGANAEVLILNIETDARTIEFTPMAGVFYDKEGSLLMSLVGRKGTDNNLSLNVYPGVVIGRKLPFGFWASTGRGGKPRLGMVSSWGLGVASGPSRAH
ncbi:MAG: hypothetical protein ABJB66_01450 [Gemmatimonadaceae bacterium]